MVGPGKIFKIWLEKLVWIWLLQITEPCHWSSKAEFTESVLDIPLCPKTTKGSPWLGLDKNF